MKKLDTKIRIIDKNTVTNKNPWFIKLMEKFLMTWTIIIFRF